MLFQVAPTIMKLWWSAEKKLRRRRGRGVSKRRKSEGEGEEKVREGKKGKVLWGLAMHPQLLLLSLVGHLTHLTHAIGELSHFHFLSHLKTRNLIDLKFSTVVLHPTKEGQFPRDPIFFGQTPVFLEGPWSGDSETVGEIEKGVRFFLREPFSQWKQATRRKSPQWPNVAGIKFVIVVPMCMLVPHEKWVKNLSWQQFSIFGAFSSSHWEKRDFIKTQAMYFVLLW